MRHILASYFTLVTTHLQLDTPRMWFDCKRILPREILQLHSVHSAHTSLESYGRMHPTGAGIFSSQEAWFACTTTSRCIARALTLYTLRQDVHQDALWNPVFLAATQTPDSLWQPSERVEFFKISILKQFFNTHSTLHTPHSTLHTPHSTLHTPSGQGAAA